MRTPASRLSTAKKGPSCGPRTSNTDPTRRVEFTDTNTSVFGWPSRGGVIVLNEATHVDFNFLGLGTTDPPRKRRLRSRPPSPAGEETRAPASEPKAIATRDVPGREDDEEDTFCQRLLLLGAKWWDSEKRHHFVDRFGAGMEPFVDDVEEGRVEEPTLRERRWVKVGWKTAVSSVAVSETGGFWLLDCDANWLGVIEEDNVVPEDAARVNLAASMDERCEILKQIGARFYPALGQYEGESTFLRAWEWKREGEIGQLKKVG